MNNAVQPDEAEGKKPILRVSTAKSAVTPARVVFADKARQPLQQIFEYEQAELVNSLVVKESSCACRVF